MYKRDSDGFFSTRVVYRSSDVSYNSIDSLLVTVCMYIALDYKLLGFKLSL